MSAILVSDHSTPAPLKEWFDASRYRRIAGDLQSICPGFDQRRFLRGVLDGLEQRSLMERLHQCALGLENTLPGTYRQQVCLLERLGPRIDHEFVAIFLCDFVATFGQDDFDFSLQALRRLTIFGSAEFAVRPFLVADQDRALTAMIKWTRDPHEKVRRLASEGSRPRLPWGLRLGSLVRDPSPTGPILEALKNDGSLSVRRSVANHLNDISKDHPAAVVERLSQWDLTCDHLRWIARHSCRTLVKRGHPGALGLFGHGRRPELSATLGVSPVRLPLGKRISLTAALQSDSSRGQRLAVDYVIHYQKNSGSTSPKVFKWTEIELPPHGRVSLQKNQIIRDFTTRKHYPGPHLVELQINGHRIATATFDLLPSDDA